MEQMIEQIKTNIKNDNHTLQQLFEAVSIYIMQYIQNKRLPEKDVVNLCSCILLLYWKDKQWGGAIGNWGEK